MKEVPAFEMTGRVEAVLITSPRGQIVSEVHGSGALETRSVEKIHIFCGKGIRGDRHAGRRLSDIRDKKMLQSFGLPKGIETANLREFSAVSVEDLAEIERSMDLPASIPFGCLGENLVVSGIPRWSELPSGTKLFFRKGTQIRTAVLVIFEENKPCTGPGEAMQICFPDLPDLASTFPKAAVGKRGVVGSVYVSGEIGVGDTLVVKVPQQRIYESPK
ncbi:MAG: MOSC domain-containing protein [Candidatus Paceibacterota bacterium]